MTRSFVQMGCHACIIEDWPLPNADDDEVRSLLPTTGEVPIIAVDPQDSRVGAVWTFHNDPPLLVDSTGISFPELCIAVAPGRRGYGVGSALIDALFAAKAGTLDGMCTNVHVRNPAQKLYMRKGFHVVGQGRGPLGIAMHKDLRTG